MQIITYECLESTNITAREMALTGAEHGTVITANRQTAGRGQYDRVFYSPADHGLYMSVILHSDQMNFKFPTLITVFAAVSVCEAIEAVTDKIPEIKWVNDIFRNGKKIGGILTESVNLPDVSCSQRFIVGIGININTPETGFPDELKNIAGSLFDSETSPVTRQQLALEIRNRLIDTGGSDDGDNEQNILDKYRQRMFLIGKTVTVTTSGETYKAVAEDINDLGQLVVRKSSGEQISLFSGNVVIVR